MSIITIDTLSFIKPDWNAPSHIKAFTTTRLGGYSTPPFDAFNLGLNVSDDRHSTVKNRELLTQSLKLPEPPRWVSQTHSTIVQNISEMEATCEADATFTTENQHVCAILTADCLPIVLTNTDGSYVAAIHAGWRGLLNGILENTLHTYVMSKDNMLVWLAPAISQKAFEVGLEVKDAFLASNPNYAQHFIDSQRPQHFFADLYGIAKNKLTSLGIPLNNISGGDYCTYSDEQYFYSHRRDGKNSGRQATLIWIDK